MEKDQEKQPAEQPKERPEYARPQLRRWGTLRDLTAGGGGLKNEPTTRLATRF